MPTAACRVRRRDLLAAGAALWFMRPARAAALPGFVPADGALAFRVCRNGSAIGTHGLNFSQSGSMLTVRIEASFRVRFGPITLYRYHHQGVEQWQDGQFAVLHTTTDDNGTQYAVSARRTGAGVAIQATGQPDLLAPADALPLTHWAVAAMAGRLFNPQTGALLRETAQPRGRGTVSLADGARISASRFALAGEAPMTDWYDSDSRWAALDAVGRDGSSISYRRL